MSYQEQIAKWKEEGIRFRELTLQEGQTLFFKLPNKPQLKLIMSKARSSAIDYGTAFVQNCYLGGDFTKDELLSEDKLEYLTEVSASIDSIVGLVKGTIKKH